jgi:hypothetical protein
MRILLVILLFAVAAANVAASLPLLNLPNAPMAYIAAPLLLSACAVASAIMLIFRRALAYLPFIIGFAILLVTYVIIEGASAIPKAGMGFIVAILFFLPSVRASSSPTSQK